MLGFWGSVWAFEAPFSPEGEFPAGTAGEEPHSLVSGEKDASPRGWEEKGKDAPGVFSLAQPPFPVSPAVPWHRSRRAGAEGARRARRYLRSSTWAGPRRWSGAGNAKLDGTTAPPVGSVGARRSAQ